MTFWGHVTYQLPSTLPFGMSVLRQTSWMRLIPIRSLSVWLFAFVGLIWELLQSPGNWFWKLIWRELPLLSHFPLYSPALHSHSPTCSEMMWMYCIFFVAGRQGSRCKSPRTSLAERVQGQTCLRRVGYQVTTLDDSGRSQSHHIGWYLVIT